jgi:RNA polymerase sigma-70 factor (ECF subfamily)
VVAASHAVSRPPDELDDLRLRRAARGDQEAFRELVELYHRRVHDLLWRMLDPSGRADRVEDLVQETFVRVFGALSRFRPDGPARLSTWILTIATRLALNELRRAGRPTVPLDAVAEHLGGGEPADRAAERRRLGRAIARAIGALPVEYRAALVLREYHGLDYAEIAEVLEIDLGTVKSRLSRARSKLRDALEEVRDV